MQGDQPKWTHVWVPCLPLIIQGLSAPSGHVAFAAFTIPRKAMPKTKRIFLILRTPLSQCGLTKYGGKLTMGLIVDLRCDVVFMCYSFHHFFLWRRTLTPGNHLLIVYHGLC